MPVLGYRSGTKLATAREEFVARAQATNKLAYLLAPPTAVDPLTDLSNYGRGAASLMNGAALSASALLEGGASAVLDGTNDYIDTGWATRTNDFPNPGGEVEKKFDNGVDFVVTREPTGVIPSHSGFYLDKHAYDGAGAETVIGTKGFTFLAAGTWTVSMYVWIPANWNGGNISIGADGSYVGATITATASNPALRDQWQRISSKFVVVGGDLAGALVIRTSAQPTEAAKGIVYSDSLLVEEGETVGTFFPRPIEHLSTGEAGWSGTPNASASDIGPFARGTARTFVFAVQRDTDAVNNAILGGKNSDGGGLYAGPTGASDVYAVYEGSGVTHAFTQALPNTTPQVVAFIHDGPNLQASLSINGGALETVALTADYHPFQDTLAIGNASGIGHLDGATLPFAVFFGALSADEISELTVTATRLMADRKYLTRISSKHACRVPKISARLDGNAEGGGGDPQPIRGVIYDSTKLIAQSDPVLVAPDAPVAWVDFVFPDAGGIPLDVADYDLGLIAGAGGSPCARLGTFDGVGKRFTAKDTYGKVATTTTETVTLPAATIKVASVTGLDTGGAVVINGMEILYTGKSTGKLTGCSGGGGVVASGSTVEQIGAAYLRAQPEAPNEEVGEFAIFATAFEATTLPDIDDVQIARYPFSYAQSIIGAVPVLESSARVGTVTWHGTRLNPERGSFAVVQRDGQFSSLVGQRIRVSTFEGAEVFAYVITEADLNGEDDLSLTRRLFLELAPLSMETLGVRVETLSEDGS